MKKIAVLAFALILISISTLSLSCGSNLSAQLEATQGNLSQTKTQLANAQNQITNLENELSQDKSQLQTTQNELTQTKTELITTQKDLETTKFDLSRTQIQLSTTQDDLIRARILLSSSQSQLDTTQTKLASSLQPPYTTMSGRQVTWVWIDTKRGLHEWTMPIDSYKAFVTMPSPNKILSLGLNNQNYTVNDFRPFVVPNSFSNVIPSLASQYPDGISFAKEMFNLVTQLTVYSTEDAPHWPLETLTEAGGDCKNLSILYASLLKASPFPYKLQFVYMDSDNPTNPIKPNHVIVSVTLGATKVYVDCTNKIGWNYWNNFQGWPFDI